MDALKRYAAKQGISLVGVPVAEQAKTAEETFSDVAENILSAYKAMTVEEMEARIITLTKGETGIEACGRLREWATNPETKAYFDDLYAKVVAKKAELEPKEEE